MTMKISICKLKRNQAKSKAPLILLPKRPPSRSSLSLRRSSQLPLAKPSFPLPPSTSSISKCTTPLPPMRKRSWQTRRRWPSWTERHPHPRTITVKLSSWSQSTPTMTMTMMISSGSDCSQILPRHHRRIRSWAPRKQLKL